MNKLNFCKSCSVCKKPVDTKENYFLLSSHKKGSLYCQSYYHIKCYNETIKINQKANEFYKSIDNEKLQNSILNFQNMIKKRREELE